MGDLVTEKTEKNRESRARRTMACGSSLLTSVAIRCLPASRSEGHFSVRFRPTSLSFSCHRLRLSTLACTRRRSTGSASSKKKKKQRSPRKDSEADEDDMDDDAFMALFMELDKDLKNDASSMDDDDDDDDFTEEDFAMLEQALTEALGGDDDDDVDDDDIELTSSSVDDIESDNDAETDDGDKDGYVIEALHHDNKDDDDEKEEEEEEEEEDDNKDDDDDEKEEEEEEEDEYEEDDDEELAKLKNWQLRRLAAALKVGRRKTSIKLLSAEVCLDRAVVLKLLRNPPPKLLLLSATLPDEPTTPTKVSEPKTQPVETIPAIVDVEPETEENLPVHVMQSRWSAQKGLKKVQIQTLEKVYRRSKHPTNTMVSSITQVTKIPRKKILKWFEDKRLEDGIPKGHKPYKRSTVPEPVDSQ